MNGERFGKYLFYYQTGGSTDKAEEFIFIEQASPKVAEKMNHGPNWFITLMARGNSIINTFDIQGHEKAELVRIELKVVQI